MSFDDQQQHEEQRLVRERAQQHERESQHRLEIQRQERELEEQERQEREENFHNHFDKPSEAQPLHAAFHETPLQSSETKKRIPNVLLAIIGAAVVGAAFWAYSAMKTPARLPTGLESSEEVSANTKLSAVSMPDPDSEVALAAMQLQISPKNSVEHEDQISQPSVAPALMAVQTTSEPTPILDSEPSPVPVPVHSNSGEQALPEITPAIALDAKSVGEPAINTEDVQPASLLPKQGTSTIETEQRIAQLEIEVEQLKQMLSQRAAAVAHADTASSSVKTVHRRKPTVPRKEILEPAPQYNGRVLSVDMWGGKPSVVVSTGDPNDKRTRVMEPGDSFNGITLREANVQNRSALFDVGGGKLIRLGVEDR